MHILFATWDGAGTVPIDFGIARRLLARGHTVTVLGDPTLAEEAAHAGVELRTWRKAPHRASTAQEDDVLKDWEPRTPIGLFRRVSKRLITGPAADYAATVPEPPRTDRPRHADSDRSVLATQPLRDLPPERPLHIPARIRASWRPKLRPHRPVRILLPTHHHTPPDQGVATTG